MGEPVIAARAAPWRIRGWALWQLPTSARAYIVAVEAAYLLALAVASSRAHVDLTSLLTFAVLAGCAMLSIEGSLRLVWRRPRRDRSNDMMAVWTLPVALLLSPLFAALIVVPVEVYFYVRVMRRAPMKCVFNISAIGLAGFAAASLREALTSSGYPIEVDALVGGASALAVTFVCVIVRQGAISLIAARLFAFLQPGTTVRGHLGSAEDAGVIAAEACTGVLVAIACAASPLAVLLAVPPVLVLQRTLLVAEFREAARTDAKTGLANSGYWREVAEREISRARSGREPLAVLLVDIDHFKDVNDRYGHLPETTSCAPSRQRSPTACGRATSWAVSAVRSSSCCSPGPTSSRRGTRPSASGRTSPTSRSRRRVAPRRCRSRFPLVWRHFATAATRCTSCSTQPTPLCTRRSGLAATACGSPRAPASRCWTSPSTRRECSTSGHKARPPTRAIR
jgi:hypothetical protein